MTVFFPSLFLHLFPWKVYFVLSYPSHFSPIFLLTTSVFLVPPSSACLLYFCLSPLYLPVSSLFLSVVSRVSEFSEDQRTFWPHSVKDSWNLKCLTTIASATTFSITTTIYSITTIILSITTTISSNTTIVLSKKEILFSLILDRNYYF